MDKVKSENWNAILQDKQEEIQKMKAKYLLLSRNPEATPLIEMMTFLKSKGISCFIDNKKNPVLLTSSPDDVFELYVLRSEVSLAIKLLEPKELLNVNNTLPTPNTFPNKVDFQVNSLKYDITFKETEIILRREKHTFTSTLFFTGSVTAITAYFAFTSKFTVNNILLYILPVPFLIAFFIELSNFFKATEIVINSKSKVIYKNNKPFIPFKEIKCISLYKTLSNEDNNETFTLELELKNKSSFTIGETDDINIYELGQKISKITGIKIRVH
ncbi:hypothetical protein RCC89_06525 [Cytophagaceae bacterium ABcell3]|nr:hypothetical protein RCC89_06525 [Cytophagaceae bacterium ABcell3]